MSACFLNRINHTLLVPLKAFVKNRKPIFKNGFRSNRLEWDKCEILGEFKIRKTYYLCCLTTKSIRKVAESTSQ